MSSMAIPDETPLADTARMAIAIYPPSAAMIICNRTTPAIGPAVGGGLLALNRPLPGPSGESCQLTTGSVLVQPHGAPLHANLDADQASLA
jgi:hypothetical protein